MTSIEGMWLLQSASNADPKAINDGNGVIVLETGRVFGGDSAMAYTGSYELADRQLTARVRAWTHNDIPGENVFGMSTPIDHIVIFRGARDDDTILGEIWSEQMPDQRLAARLTKITDLPG